VLTQARQQRLLQLNQFEEAARTYGFKQIAGVDEAGRGPLAGPVIAAACILPDGFFLPGIDDSKKLSKKMREELVAELKAHPGVIYSVAAMDALLIDQINILRAALQAMAAAIGLLRTKPDYVLIDGNQKPPIDTPCQTIVKGDTLSHSIMAAANIAKVHRDALMAEYDKEWPQYGFAQHAGYPTEAHLEALKKWGPCPIHRRSFRGVA